MLFILDFIQSVTTAATFFSVAFEEGILVTVLGSRLPLLRERAMAGVLFPFELDLTGLDRLDVPNLDDQEEDVPTSSSPVSAASSSSEESAVAAAPKRARMSEPIDMKCYEVLTDEEINSMAFDSSFKLPETVPVLQPVTLERVASIQPIKKRKRDCSESAIVTFTISIKLRCCYCEPEERTESEQQQHPPPSPASPLPIDFLV